MAFTVLIAPSGLKGSLTPVAAAEAIARGVAKAAPWARIVRAPIPDGGEGFCECLAGITGGELVPVTVCGPLGEPIAASFARLGGDRTGTAVIEIAAAAGLSLMPPDRFDIMRATSRGVGEMILAALDGGASRLLIGCGDSGVNDAGIGMIQALGGRFLDASGDEVVPGGAGLADLAWIDLSGLDPRLASVEIEVAVNASNALVGPRGVARVYGPQKGATPRQVEVLSEALERFAGVVRATTGADVADLPGAGASGGMGASLAALLGARLSPRYEVISRYLDLDALLREADLVMTAEGALDAQTPHGKVPAEIGRRARVAGVPVVALAGVLGPGCESALESGVDAFASLAPGPLTLAEAVERAPVLLAHASENLMRAIQVGVSVRSRARRRSPATVAPVRKDPQGGCPLGSPLPPLWAMQPMAVAVPVRE